MIELSILKLLLKKNNYLKYNNNIYNIKTEQEIYKILVCISKYYEAYNNHEYISVDELKTFFYLEYPSERTNAVYEQLFEKLQSLEVSDSVASSVVSHYIEREYSAKILEKILPIIQSTNKGALLEVDAILTEYKAKLNVVEEDQFRFLEVSDDELQGLSSSDVGFKWRLKCLNESIGPLKGGTLGHIFARPESGKTSFLTSEVANFATQLREDEAIMWFCNEEKGSKVVQRFHHSLLNKTPEEFAVIVATQREKMHQVRTELGYDKVHFYHDANLSFETINSYLQQFKDRVKVKMLVVDIADHVHFRGGGDLAQHQRLGELYRRYRQLACEFNMDVITAGQASSDVHGRKVVDLDSMHNSKTDKPGALDYAIGIGSSGLGEDTYLRWISICKNKIGATRQPTTTVRFDKERGRYLDI